MSDFSINLKKFREAAGLTRIELAARVGTSNTAIGYYETGKREPQIPILIAIATALHCSTDELLGYQVDEFEHYKSMLENELGMKVSTDGDNVTVTAPTDNLEFCFLTRAELVTGTQTAMINFRKENRHILYQSVIRKFTKYQSIHSELDNALALAIAHAQKAGVLNATSSEFIKKCAIEAVENVLINSLKGAAKIAASPAAKVARDIASNQPLQEILTTLAGHGDATPSATTPPATTPRAPKKRTTKNPRSKKNED